MQPEGFDLVYEQGPCLVVIKPGGLLTQAPPGIDSLEVRVKQFLKARDEKPGKVYLGVPHRLDRPVSGLLVLARHARAARRLCEQFEGRTVEKTYWALVEGDMRPDADVWTDWARKVPGEARAEVVADNSSDARQAVLRYEVLARFDSKCLLRIRLDTGRFHQIRVQCSFRGHPVVGDSLYGATTTFGPCREDPRERWIALHARQLSFRHPMTGQRVTQTAPLSEHWPEHWRVQ